MHICLHYHTKHRQPLMSYTRILGAHVSWTAATAGVAGRRKLTPTVPKGRDSWDGFRQFKVCHWRLSSRQLIYNELVGNARSWAGETVGDGWSAVAWTELKSWHRWAAGMHSAVAWTNLVSWNLWDDWSMYGCLNWHGELLQLDGWSAVAWTYPGELMQFETRVYFCVRPTQEKWWTHVGNLFIPCCG